MDYEALHEDLQLVLEELRERNQGVPVIVEGDRDRRSLQALGLRGEIITLNQGTTLFRVCEDVGRRHKEAIILTDWDVRGGRLARALRDGLSANGVRYDDALRARITFLCRKDIKDVESLHGHAERVRERAQSGDRAKPSKRWYGERRR